MKTIRESLGVTQLTLAEALGCTQGNVSFYENGQMVPPDAAKRLIAYAKTLGHTVTFDGIYGDAIPSEADRCHVEAAPVVIIPGRRGHTPRPKQTKQRVAKCRGK